MTTWTEQTPKTVDMAAAVQIQTKVAEYANSGFPVFATEDDYLAAPYSEGFYDNCIIFWEESGYDPSEVRETVDEAVAELRRTYA